jgi:inosine-uridine nucleoside N-ribohydrolase
MVRTAKKFPGEITLISIAPCSNIAAAIKSDPNFPKNIRNLVMMGGTYLA